MHVCILVGLLLHWNNIILYLHSSVLLRDSKGYIYTTRLTFQKSLEAKQVIIFFYRKEICERLVSEQVEEQKLDPHSFLSYASLQQTTPS